MSLDVDGAQHSWGRFRPLEVFRFTWRSGNEKCQDHGKSSASVLQAPIG